MKRSTNLVQSAGKSDFADRNQISNYIAAKRFAIGDVYLFHKTDRRCPRDSSLWGMFDKCEGETVYLESSSSDREVFDTWCRLPEGYIYCRPASRAELREYIFSQTWVETRKLAGREK